MSDNSTTVNFNLRTAGFVNYANQTLTFRLLTAGATGSNDFVVLPSVVTATSDSNGDGSVVLFRNGVSDIESVHEVIFPNREKAQFIIPSGTSTVELSNLLVNSQPTGSNTQQSSVYAQAIQRANHTGTQPLSTISDASTVQLKPSEGAFANGDKTKLNAIEASADVTDTANVTAAGALMDSEMQDGTGAAIKALTLPASPATTISTFAQTFLDDTSAAAVKSTLGITDVAAQVNFVSRNISFTDTSAFLSLADAGDHLDVGTNNFTLSFWARLDANDAQPVLQKNGSAGYAVFFDAGILKLILNTSGSSTFNLATGLADSKWHCYVVTVDRDGNAVAYVDNVAQTGVDVSSKAGTLDNGSDFQIGIVGSDAGDGIALGNYVALHKDVLTASEAAQIYFSPDAALTITRVATSLMVDLRKVDKIFTDLSTNGLAVTTNGTIIFNEGRLTEFTGTNVLATTTLGYTTGSGGTVTQASNKTTAVTLNKINGEIVMNAAALADDATAAFTLTNSTIAATDVVIVNVASVGTAGAYQVTVGAVAAGSCSISVLNVSGGSLSQAIKLNFAVIKSVAS